MNNDQRIAEAARWAARLGAPDRTPADERAFEAWLDADPANRAAFASVDAAARRVREAIRSSPALRQFAVDAIRETPEPARRRWLAEAGEWFGTRAFAAATFAVVAVVCGALLFTRFDAGTDVRYANATSAQQRVALADGSVMYLDIGASATVRLAPNARTITLSTGRAFFDVAHDASRPFAVLAGSTRTVALGTRFEVDAERDAVDVTLVQGRVEVVDRRGVSTRRVVLSPGERVRVLAGSEPLRTQAVDAARVTNWSRGRLVFDGESLASVADEVNRYGGTRIRIADASLADVPIGGTFEIGGGSERFVSALEAILPVRTHYDADAHEIVLHDARKDAPR